MRQKIFCLGFQKTGTSTLGIALSHMGYSVTGYHPFRIFADDRDVTIDRLWDAARPFAHQFDAAQDTPWPLLYRHLDQEFPQARFIHVVRDEGSWIKSACKDFGRYPNEIHRLIYGSPYPVGHEEEWLRVYRQHNRDVEAYFENASDRYLKIALGSPEYGWEAICAFLGEPVPQLPWPHVNKAGTKERLARIARLKARLRKIFGMRAS